MRAAVVLSLPRRSLPHTLMNNTERFIAARDQLLGWRDNWALARADFRWPAFSRFNWVGDYFEVVAAGNPGAALRVVDDAGGDETVSFATLAGRAARGVAQFLSDCGVRRADRLLLMLPNCVALWEVMLAAIRMGAVIIPATTLLERDDLRDRLERGRVRAVITRSELTERFAGLARVPVRVAVGARVADWHDFQHSREAGRRHPVGDAAADELLLIYFTSGTTARPRLVAHSHVSYPVGHLSTMYWLGLKAGDVHLNVSSPGWAKHAWSSFFAPWNAGATVLAYHFERFEASALLDQLVRCKVTTFCAPPTVWRTC